MLILGRKVGESVIIDGNIEVKVLHVVGNKVRLGITAPREITVNRDEIQQRIDEETK